MWGTCKSVSIHRFVADFSLDNSMDVVRPWRKGTRTGLYFSICKAGLDIWCPILSTGRPQQVKREDGEEGEDDEEEEDVDVDDEGDEHEDDDYLQARLLTCLAAHSAHTR